MSDSSNTGGGISLATALGLIFIVLKLTGHITWSWWWVLSPFWISGILAIVSIIILALLGKL